MKNLLKFSALAAILVVLAFGCSQDEPVQPTGPASGIQAAALVYNETLGVPEGLVVATGSGMASAGVGLYQQAPSGTIDLKPVLDGTETIKQVILYWEGQHFTPAGDATIKVDGVDVTGTLIGGPDFFYAPYSSSSYRADITALNLIGDRELEITEMAFEDKNSGAGVLVIFEKMGDPASTIMIRDGNDLAFRDFAEPQKSCVAQDFFFAPATVDRQAYLTFHLGSLEPPADPLDPSTFRPDILYWSIDGGAPNMECNPFEAVDATGEWATTVVALTIPANATKLTIQPASDYCDAYTATPQSFAWVAAGLEIKGVPMGEGCTPGYWKNIRMHGCEWTAPYTPGSDFDTVFGVDIFDPDLTLIQALNNGGGHWNALGRHAVAALLSAANPDVDYALSPAEVIAKVQAAYAADDPEPYKNELAMYNEMGCPLNNCK